MKKRAALFLTLMMVLSFTACGNKPSADIDQTVYKAEDYSFSKVTNYLYEITLADYEQYIDDANTFFLKYNPKIGGCSSVQNGTIRGRNYDWTYDEEPEYVIHVPSNNSGRHASIGVAATTEITVEDIETGDGSYNITAADLETGTYYDIYKIIPYLTLDGMNDAGLTVNVNVVGYEEKGEYVMKTADPSDDICPIMVPRILLDNAASIDEALALIEKMDVYSLGEMEEAHFMISGPQSSSDDTFNTVVVEFIPDANKHYQMSVIDYNKGDFVDNKPVMTNFHLTGFDGSIESATRHPMGFERYQELLNNYDQGSDISGMIDLMKKVYYTRTYDLYNENFWYSEYLKGELDMTMTGEKNLMGDISKAGVFADALRPGIESYKSMKRDGSTWHTVHTSVYDIENRALYVVPQEGGFSYSFTLE